MPVAGEKHDVIIVGAGFSGLSMLHLLKKKGFKVLLLEGTDDIGGTWSQNRYPGVRTDCESRYYCSTLSDEVINEWDWSERYPEGKEVHKYLLYFAERLDLWPNIQLNSWVNKLKWNEEATYWKVETASGNNYISGKVVLAAVLLQKAYFPNIAGMNLFDGKLLHTSKWPKNNIELKNKKVGVIGVGSSGVQLIPSLAKDGANVTVFQRTPNYVVPAVSEKLSAEEREAIRDAQHEIIENCKMHPFGVDMLPPKGSYEELTESEKDAILNENWTKGGFHFLCRTFTDLNTNEEAAWYASKFIQRKIAEIVHDPVTAKTLTPTEYPVGTKRLSTGIEFYESFNRPNVRLVDVKNNPIEKIDKSGVWVDGNHISLDVLICATGFDALTGSIDAIEICGRKNLLLKEHWEQNNLDSFLGITVNGFPNLFMMLGPHTPAGNLAVIIQEQAKWIAHLLEWARSENIDVIESAQDDDQKWSQFSEKAVENTLLYRFSSKAKAWFFGYNVDGKKVRVNTFFGGLPTYLEKLAEAEKNKYGKFIPKKQ